MDQLNMDDLTHRFSGTYLKFYREEKMTVGQLKLVESENAYFYCFDAEHTVQVPLEDVVFKAPNTKYINYNEKQAVYIAKTGDRYFKKGFTLERYGDKYLYKVYNPVEIRLRMLESISEDVLFMFDKNLIISGEGSLDSFSAAIKMFNPVYSSFTEAKDRMMSKSSLSRALSPKLCFALSSNSEFHADIYYELFLGGHIDFDKKLVKVFPEFYQEISDYFRGLDHGEYQDGGYRIVTF